MRTEPLISCFWDTHVGEVVFKVHEAFHTLPVEGKVAAMEDIRRQLVETRAELGVEKFDPFKKLSDGEREVVAMSLRGLKSREIAELTGRTVGTIDTMRSRAMRKAGVRGLVQLALAAAAAGGGT